MSELKEEDLLTPYSEAQDSGTGIGNVSTGGNISFKDALKYNFNKKLGRDVDISDYQKAAASQASEESNDE